MSGKRRADATHPHGPAKRSSAGPSGELHELSPERFAEIHQRIAEGTYDSPATLDRLARRLLDSGDV